MAALFFGLLAVLLSTRSTETSQIEINAGDSLADLLHSAGLKTGAGFYSSQCTETGFECLSCSTLSMNIYTSIGPVTVAIECNTTRGEYCNRYLKRCSDRKSDCSFEGLQCHQEGWFPHPFDCTKYYECVLEQNGTLAALEHVCSSETSYNAKTYQCEGSKNGTMCQEYPVPECPDSPCRDVYPLPQNPNIFYTCVGGVPQLYKCTEGEDYYYDPDLLQCERNQNVPTNTTVVPPTTTEGPDNSTVPGDSCLPDTTYHIPYGCREYYYCSELPSPKWHECSLGMYYDRDTNACVQGECPYTEENSVVCNGTVFWEAFPLPGICNGAYFCVDFGVLVGKCATETNYFDRDYRNCFPGPCPYKDL